MAEIKKSLAIVIGIDRYTHIPKLKSAVNDARAIADVLEKRYNYKVLCLLDEKATSKNLSNLLENLQKQIIQIGDEEIPVEESDRVLFYFAGHGIAQKAEETQDKDVKPAGYLMPQNSQENDNSTWLSMQELHDTLTDLKCRHLLMILDCCFAGAIRWAALKRNSGGFGRKLYQQSYNRFIKFTAQQVITSAAYDQEAQDTSRFVRRKGDKNEHSPFADLLLKVLKAERNTDTVKQDNHLKAIVEDGVITAQELFTYLQNKLGHEVEEQKEQTPELFCLKKHDKGEYIFLPHGVEPNLEKLELNKDTNPYKGLASFEKEDSQLFFGRKRLIEGSKEKEGLLSKVSGSKLTVVLGLSGSGKSSLVKAGLIPALEQETGQQKWVFIETMRPGESPLNALNKILTKSGSASSTILSLSYEEKIKVIYNKIDDLISPDSKLLLVIDQAEELFTLCQNQEERIEFINLLAQLLTNKGEQLRIVLTLRTEFEPQIRDALKEPNWQEAWKDGRFFVTKMDREELKQAIEEPAAQVALFFESPKLVNDLIDEVVDMPGALPLLSFTLSELYLKYLNAYPGGKDDRTITETDYKEIGGVTRSLTKSADDTYKKLVEEKKVYESTIRDVMLRMVAISGAGPARRQVPKSELHYPGKKKERADEVIKRFVEARLLVKDLDADGQEYIEPAHDALIRGWEMLEKWIADDKETLLLQRRLTSSVKRWQLQYSLEFRDPDSFKQGKILLNREEYLKTQTASNFLWHSDPYLEGLQQVLNSGDKNWLNKDEKTFVERSLKRRRINRLLIALERIPVALVTIGLSLHLIFYTPNVLIKFLGIMLLALSLSMLKSLFR
jgi:Caspase domain/NACHT domain